MRKSARRRQIREIAIESVQTTAEDLAKAHIALAFKAPASAVASVLEVDSIRLEGWLHVVASEYEGRNEPTKRYWECLPLYSFAEFSRRFPKQKVRLRPDSKPTADTIYFGVQIKTQGGDYIVGPLSEGLRIIQELAKKPTKSERPDRKKGKPR